MTYDEAYSTTQCAKADALIYNKRSPSLSEKSVHESRCIYKKHTPQMPVSVHSEHRSGLSGQCSALFCLLHTSFRQDRCPFPFHYHPVALSPGSGPVSGSRIRPDALAVHVGQQLIIALRSNCRTDSSCYSRDASETKLTGQYGNGMPEARAIMYLSGPTLTSSIRPPLFRW